MVLGEEDAAATVHSPDATSVPVMVPVCPSEHLQSEAAADPASLLLCSGQAVQAVAMHAMPADAAQACGIAA